MKSSKKLWDYRETLFLMALTPSWKEIDNAGKAPHLVLSQPRNQRKSSKRKRNYLSRNIHKA